MHLLPTLFLLPANDRWAMATSHATSVRQGPPGFDWLTHSGGQPTPATLRWRCYDACGNEFLYNSEALIPRLPKNGGAEFWDGPSPHRRRRQRNKHGGAQ